MSFQWLLGLILSRVISYRDAQKDLCSRSCVMSRLGHSILELDHLVPTSAPDQLRKGISEDQVMIVPCGNAGWLLHSDLISEEGWDSLVHLTVQEMTPR